MGELRASAGTILHRESLVPRVLCTVPNSGVHAVLVFGADKALATA